MATKKTSTKAASTTEKLAARKPQPQCIAVAKRGINSYESLAALVSAVTTDSLAGLGSLKDRKSIIWAASKLLRIGEPFGSSPEMERAKKALEDTVLGIKVAS
jgi:hypothetical protein